MTGSPVIQYGGMPDWDATTRKYDGQLTFSFEVRFQDDDEWLPFDELSFPDIPLDGDYAGQHEFDAWYGDPLGFAESELESALVAILATLGKVERVRINLWTTEQPPSEPFVTLQATDTQMEIGHLRAARERVAAAARALDEARDEVRDQILRVHSSRLLGVNKIAHEVGGGLTRRLVLALVAGREIIKSVQWIITGTSEPEFYWTSYWSPRPQQAFSGPFKCGPLILTLAADGTVSATFDRHDEDDCAYDSFYDGPDADARWAQYQADALANAQAKADELVPKLESRGIMLLNADGTVAGAADLAQTRLDYDKALIVRRN